MNFSNSLLLQRFEDLVGAGEEPGKDEQSYRGEIVLAESDPADLEHISSILRSLGFRVFTAGDGRTALRLVMEHGPVLVLSSLELPSLDGYKLCQTLRETRATEKVPFMFVLGQDEFPDRLIGHESFAHDYIQKPISVPEFKNRLQALVNLAESEGVDAIGSVDEENTVTDENGPGSPLVEVLGRSRELLQELQLCLDELEALIGEPTTDSAIQPGTEETVEVAGNGEEGEIETRWESDSEDLPASAGEDEAVDTDQAEVDNIADESQVAQFLAEYRERSAQGIPLADGRGLEEGVDDLFAEFFRMESAQREGVETGGEDASEIEALKTQTMDLEEAVIDGGSTYEESDTPLGNVKPFPDISRGDSQLYDEACAYVLDSIRNVEDGGVDVFRGAGIAERIVDSLARDKGLVLEATRRDQDYSVSRHCVNVAVFATRIAQTLNCDLQAQREVCLGGLLHELGVSRLPSKLVHKSDLLTSSEVKQLKRRPLGSAEIINRLGKEYRWLGRMVSQVMERENGTGYPVGLGGDEIIEGAKILGIADVFDACIHQRPYREALSGYQALFELTTDQQRAFPDHLVKALIKGFSLYPFNECVRLSTGEVGTVVDINDENLSRPIVTVLFDSNGEEVSDSRVVDLSREPALFIEEALSGTHCS